jgi:hypothetical protein
MEFNERSQESIEACMLWGDIVEKIFPTNIYQVGMQPSFDGASSDKIVLVSRPKPADEYRLQLWRYVQDGQDTVVIVYKNKQTNQEAFSYELTESALHKHSAEDDCFDKDELDAVRADLEEAQWDETNSRNASFYMLFLS